MSTYTVQQGDSPSSIARKFSMPLADLLAANAQKPTTVVSGVTTWQTLAVGENLSVPSGVGAAAAVAINAMNADPNYCKSVGLPGSPVNIAVHNFKKAWNTAFPLKPLPVGTGKYEVTVAAALASIVGNADPSAVVYAPSACVPHQRPTYSEPMHGVSDAPVGGSATGLPGNTITGGFNSPIPAGGSAKGEPDNTITGGFNTPSAAPPPDPPAISATPQGPSPAALVATGTLVSIAATAAGALSADPNYCKSVGQPGSPVNKAVHDFKKAWNAANPGNTVPVGTGKYEAAVATALMSVLEEQVRLRMVVRGVANTRLHQLHLRLCRHLLRFLRLPRSFDRPLQLRRRSLPPPRRLRRSIHVLRRTSRWYPPSSSRQGSIRTASTARRQHRLCKRKCLARRLDAARAPHGGLLMDRGTDREHRTDTTKSRRRQWRSFRRSRSRLYCLLRLLLRLLMQLRFRMTVRVRTQRQRPLRRRHLRFPRLLLP